MSSSGFTLAAVGSALSFIIATSSSAQSGGDYDQTWHSVDGGSATVSGGAYELSCTIGQPDSAELAGGAYVLSGGFWPAFSSNLDCNGNGIPDDVEIAACDPMDPEYPGCDDCNLNKIPDECDIAGGGSLDVDPIDGVPDECYDFAGQCPGNNPAWSCGGNWNLDGNYPDDVAGVPDLSVTLDNRDLSFLDVDVVIDTLRILDDATLLMTQTGAAGDLTVTAPGGIFNEGNLLIGDGRTIDVSAGAFTVGPSGVYQADPEAAGTVRATLTAGNVTVLGADPGAPPTLGGVLGGSIVMSGSMTLDCLADLQLFYDDKGSGTPPPAMAVLEDSEAGVVGDFIMEGAAKVTQTSSHPLVVGGDFINHLNVTQQSDSGAVFDWAGTLRFNGPGHTIEAAGENRGPWPIGMVDNFAIGTLQLATGTAVTVIDTFDNQEDGATNCNEALYIGTLVLEPGSMLSSTACRLYYGTLENNGGNLSGSGIEQVRPLGDVSDDGCVNPTDLAVLLGSWGPCPAQCAQSGPGQNCPADFNADCTVGPQDLAMLLGNWGCG